MANHIQPWHIIYGDPCLLHRQDQTRILPDGYWKLLVRQLQLRRLHGLGKNFMVLPTFLRIQISLFRWVNSTFRSD